MTKFNSKLDRVFLNWWHEASPPNLAHSRKGWQLAIETFCEEVNRRAEEKMLKTGVLEGSHYAAMQELKKEMSETPR